MASSSVNNCAEKCFACVRALLFQHARIGGHEGGVERAFAEDGAEMVGQAERDGEGVGEHARAKDRAHHDVADEARDRGREA